METQKQNALFTDAESTNNLGFSNNTKLLEKKEIENTPFVRVMTDEGDFMTIGVKAITGKLTKEEADEKEENLKKTDWKMIMSAISVIVTETVAQLHLDMMKYNEQIENQNTTEQ